MERILINAVALLLTLLAGISCAGGGNGKALLCESVPTGRLPSDIRPIRYELILEILPEHDEFTGTALIEIDLDRARKTIWLHGRGLQVTEASVEPACGDPLPARWEPAHESGVAALRLPRAVGPGTATVRISYRGNFRIDKRPHANRASIESLDIH